MLSVERAATAAMLTCSAMLACVGPAFAGDWFGDVDCGQAAYAGCALGAGQGGRDVSPAPGPGAPRSPHEPEGPALSAPPGDTKVGQDDRARCSYVRSDYQLPSGVKTASYSSGAGGVSLVSLRSAEQGHVVSAQAENGGGAWYVYRCSGTGARDALFRAPVWIPDGQAPGAAPVPSPEELAAQARAQLRLPSPLIASSPAGTQLVRLPTWLWLDRDGWLSRTATAAVPAVSVTATATPVSVVWSMGDGSTVTCTGPGTPFTSRGDPRAASPDCGHTYQRSSAGAPGEQFRVTATVSWRIAWAGAGASGTFPDLTTSASAALRVAEAQALGTG